MEKIETYLNRQSAIPNVIYYTSEPSGYKMVNHLHVLQIFNRIDSALTKNGVRIINNWFTAYQK